MSQIYIPGSVATESTTPVDIGWTSSPTSNLGYLMNSVWRTNSDLVHLSNPAAGDVRTQTETLVLTNFSIPITTIITGIQFDLKVQRFGRIVDQLIQLTYQGVPIGQNKTNYITDNLGNLPITNDSIYGGPTDLWGVDVTPDMLNDPSFGVLLKFQAHPYYPCKQSMNLYTSTLTVY